MLTQQIINAINVMNLLQLNEFNQRCNCGKIDKPLIPGPQYVGDVEEVAKEFDLSTEKQVIADGVDPNTVIISQSTECEDE